MKKPLIFQGKNKNKNKNEKLNKYNFRYRLTTFLLRRFFYLYIHPMRKKIIATLLCGFLALNLTACSIPFFNKKVEDPQKSTQRTPDEVFYLMLDKMGNEVKTADYKATANIVAVIDQEKLSLETKKKLNNKILAIGTDRTHVLGIDNSEELAPITPPTAPAESSLKRNEETDVVYRTNMAEPMEIEYSRAPSLDSSFYDDSTSLFNFGKNKIKVKIDYDIEGRFDNNDKDNPKGESKLAMEVDASGVIVRFDFEAKVLEDNIYFKIDQLPAPFSMMVDAELLEKWWNINLKEVEEEQKKEDGIFSENISDNFSLYFDDEKTKELQIELEEMMKKYKLFKVKEVLDEESIDDKVCYHYKIEFNKNTVRNAFLELFDFVEEKIYERLEVDEPTENIEEIVEIKKMGNSANEKEKEKFKEMVGQLVNVISESDIDVWIDKDEYFLRKTKFDFKLNMKNLDFEELTEEIKDAIEIDITGEIKYSNINNEVNIVAPIEYESLLSYLNNLLGDTRARSRDTKRIVDIKQIQTALELYYSDNAKYPANINDLEESGYFKQIPNNPRPNDGVCGEDFEYIYKVESGNEDYRLDYCMGLSFGGILAGYNTACSSGINNCRAETPLIQPNKNIDTDLDGLFDWEEIKIYKTNPNDSDTDKDGYLDGDEVKNGYNPAGPGNLSGEISKKILKSYDGGNFSVEYPNGWSVDDKIAQISAEEKKISGIKLQILSPYDDASDKFRENVLVSIVDISDSSLKTLNDWNTNFITNPEYKVIESKKTIIAATPGIDFRYYTETEKDGIKQKIMFRDRYFIKDGFRYSFLFSGNYIENTELVDYESEAIQIMNSLKLK